MNNSTAIYIKNKYHIGGVKSRTCNDIAKIIWIWAKTKGIWSTASYLPGTLNFEADHESRVFNDRTEWQSDKVVFSMITGMLGLPDIDLFATRLNKQPSFSHGDLILMLYIYTVDAFTLDCHSWYFYTFPPFSVLGKTLQKVALDQATRIIIAPVWTTQPWFAQILQMLVSHPILLPMKATLLQLPGTAQLHPLRTKLRLMACLVSGNRLKSRTFLEQQPTLSCHHGGKAPTNSTVHMLKDGCSFVLRSKQICCIQM